MGKKPTQFLQSALLGFRQKEEDYNKCHHVQSCVEPEGCFLKLEQNLQSVEVADLQRRQRGQEYGGTSHRVRRRRKDMWPQQMTALY